MKLLLDENLSRRIVPLLVTDYPGTSQVALLGLEQSSDLDLWDYAKENDYVIVTKDADFHELSIVNSTPPKVIWLKIGNVSKVEVARTLLEKRESIEIALAMDATKCVEVY